MEGRDGRSLAALWLRAQHTGTPAPGVTLTLTMFFAALATLTVVPAVLVGSVGASMGLVSIAMILSLLPALFAPEHGRAAAVCRVAAIALSVAALVAISVHLWG